MRICIGFCTLWLTLLATVNARYQLFCYYTDWSYTRPGIAEFQISNINPKLCTHMIYAFIGITAEGDVVVTDPPYDLGNSSTTGGFEKFVALKKVNKKLKTLVSIGEWTASSDNFSVVAKHDDLRATFAQNVVEFLDQYGFDGLDLNWQYPNSHVGDESDIQNHVLLLEKLRDAFECHGFILTALVSPGHSTTASSYNVSGIAAAVDYINMMTYDYHGYWDTAAGHNTPLYASRRETSAAERTRNINASVRNWISLGAPAAKLILGMATWGRTFTLTNARLHGPGSPVSGVGTAGNYTGEAGALVYYEICPLNWTVVYDKEQHVPYAYHGDQWVSYDNVKSMTEKAKYVKSMGLAGAVMWSVDQDDFRGICGVKYPLLTTLYHVLRKRGTKG